MLDEVLLQATGTLRPFYEAVRWSGTPLGPVSAWTPSQRAAVDLALNTRFPVCLFFGPELIMVYNAAYVELIGDKHPAALGAPARDVFPEAWDAISPMMEAVMNGEGANWLVDARVPLQRNGRLEECFFTFSYSPIRDEYGRIEGLMDIAAETTAQVLDRRRLALLSRLGEQLGDLEHAEDLPVRALPVLAQSSRDLPAADLRGADGLRTDGDRRLPDVPPVRLPPGRVIVEPDGSGRPVAWLRLNLSQSTGGSPVLVALLSPHLRPDGAYLEFLGLIGSALTQALDRVAVRDAERRAADAARGMSEALQRSLLSEPLQPDGLQVAVRYRPAAQESQVGGDWYDSFLLPDGSLSVVIGDVAGHDRQAAVAMGQIRNMLRGVAYTLQVSPALVLSALDGAMAGLDVASFATAVLARVEQDAIDAPRGQRTLRWSNAGHPPPVLLLPDGSVELLETPPDPVLGPVLGDRADHTVTLVPGSSVVLYTDGLVERRGVPLDTSFEWLAVALHGRQHMDAEGLADHLVEQLGAVEDDIAVLVLRVEG